jgi:GNAT superfamily N-acetyltransferase
MPHRAEVPHAEPGPEPAPFAGVVAAEYVRVHVLDDGRRILVRPLVASDRAQLVAGYGTLSPESRRARFGTPPDRLSEHQLDQLLDLDYEDRFAICAVDPESPHVGFGVARYARDPGDPTAAEAAVVVLDQFQHHGIGRILLEDLIDIARMHGIGTLTASVRWDNTALVDAIRAVGATIEPAEPGVALVRYEIEPAGPA